LLLYISLAEQFSRLYYPALTYWEESFFNDAVEAVVEVVAVHWTIQLLGLKCTSDTIVGVSTNSRVVAPEVTRLGNISGSGARLFMSLKSVIHARSLEVIK